MFGGFCPVPISQTDVQLGNEGVLRKVLHYLWDYRQWSTPVISLDVKGLKIHRDIEIYIVIPYVAPMFQGHKDILIRQ